MRQLQPVAGFISLALILGACDPGTNGGDGGVSGMRIGGVVTGLEGEGLTLVLNGGTPLPISESGLFVFPEPVARDSEYTVTVGTQPSAPAQTCVVVNGAGVAISSVVDVTVNCDTVDYAIGGTIQNFRGGQLVLRNNGGPALTVLRTASGTAQFEFPERLPAGSAWAITVEEQPRTPSQLCQVTANATGTVAAADVNNIIINCTEVSFTIGGSAVGLGTSAVTLRLNGDDSLSVGQNGTFSFPRPLPSGADYVVSIQQQPADKICSLQAGSGTVGDEPVTNIAVVCGPSSYTVSGSVSGLLGSGLVLRNNGSDDLAIASNGDFSFPAPVTGGVQYLVSVAVQPSNPWQTCVVANAAGQGTGNVSNVRVTCTTNSYTVGGTLTNVRAAGLVLQLNGAMTISPSATDSSFVFPGTQLSNTPYTVTIVGEPAGRDCTIANGSGTVTSQNIWTIQVSCIADGDTRANAFTLDVASSNVITFSGDTRTAINHSSTPSCGCTSGPDLFYRFNLAVPSIVYADAFGTTYDVSLYLQDVNGVNVAANLTGGDACDDDACGTFQSQITARLPAGTHYLAVSGCGSGVAQVRFHHEPAPSGLIRNVSAVGTTSFSGNLLGFSSVAGDCYDTQGAEDAFWWRTCPSQPAGTVSASTCSASTTFDTILDYVSTTGAGYCVDDTTACGLQAQFSTSAPAGAALHVLYVDSFSDPADAGYSLTVTRP